MSEADDSRPQQGDAAAAEGLEGERLIAAAIYQLAATIEHDGRQTRECLRGTTDRSDRLRWQVGLSHALELAAIAFAICSLTAAIRTVAK